MSTIKGESPMDGERLPIERSAWTEGYGSIRPVGKHQAVWAVAVYPECAASHDHADVLSCAACGVPWPCDAARAAAAELRYWTGALDFVGLAGGTVNRGAIRMIGRRVGELEGTAVVPKPAMINLTVTRAEEGRGDG